MNAFLVEASRWLWDYYLLATILLATVLVVNKIITQPAQRMAIHWSAAAGLLLLALMCAVPGWSVVHMISTPVELPLAEVAEIEPLVEEPYVDTAKWALALTLDPPATINEFPAAAIAAETPASEPTLAEVPPVEATPIDYGFWSLAIASVGAVFTLLWLAVGSWQVRRLRAQAQPAPARLTDLLAKLARDEHAPDLGVAKKLPVAVAVGLRQPMVLLPSTFLERTSPETSPKKLQTVLAHELAHIRHRDLWLLALLRGLLLILWAHPLFWLWRRSVRLDQETLADAAASEVTSRTDYAEQLVDWARLATDTRAPRLASSVGLWESPSQLKRRIAILLDDKLTVLRACSRGWRIGSATLLLLMVGALSTVTLQPSSVAVADPPAHPVEDITPIASIAKKFSNGGRVEVIAIGTHALQQQQWWDANGQPLSKLPFETRPANNISPAPNRQIVFRTKGLSEDAYVKWQTMPSSNSGMGTLVVDGQEKPPGYYCHLFEKPKQGEKLSLRVGVAVGKWATVATGKNNATGSLFGNVVISDALADSDGNAIAIVSHNYYRKAATRGIAIDKSGKQHIAAPRGGASAGNQNQTKWKFVGLAPEEVQEFGLQVRPYEWVEFKDLPANAKKEVAKENTSEKSDEAQTSTGDWTLVASESPVADEEESLSQGSLVLSTPPADSDESSPPRFEVRDVDRIAPGTDLVDLLKKNPNFLVAEWANPQQATATLSYDKTRPPLLLSSDIATAVVKPAEHDKESYSILVELTPAAGKRFKQETQKLIGSRLAILLEGEIIMAPRLHSAISNSMVITGSFSKAQAEKIAGILDGNFKPVATSTKTTRPDAENVKANTLAPVRESSSQRDEIHELRLDHTKRLHQLRKPNTILGICLDEKGQPLAGVPVQVFSRRLDGSEDNPRPIFETKSNAQGEFTFSNVVDIAKEYPSGLPEEIFQGSKVKVFNIQGRLAGRVPGIGSNTMFHIARDGHVMVWVMSPAKTLRGRVTNDQGQPVAGAKVDVGYYANQGGSHGINTATTNTSGEYVINDLASENRSSLDQALFVTHPKYAMRRAKLPAIPGKLDVQLTPGSIIEGNVAFPANELFAEKTPFTGGMARLQRVMPDPKPGDKPGAYDYQVLKASIDTRGHYRFKSLPAGKYHLTADVDGWVTQGLENVEVARGKTTIAPDIELKQGGSVQVQLIDNATGQPMRFDKPTKGFVHAQSWPPRAITAFHNNIVDFSTKGTVEIQLPAGRYFFHASLPTLTGRPDLVSVVSETIDEQSTEAVVDGEQLNVTISLKKQKPSTSGDGELSFFMKSSPSDETPEQEAPKEETPTDSFTPATPPADNDEEPSRDSTSKLKSKADSEVVDSEADSEVVDSEEIAILQELVNANKIELEKVNALQKVGAQGGQTRNVLLVKYHLATAQAQLSEAKMEPPQAIKHYQAATTATKAYVTAMESVHATGHVTLSELLEAKKLYAEAKLALLRAERRLTKAKPSGKDN